MATSTARPAPATGRAHGGPDVGYARVSTTRQSLERQLDALSAEGIPDERTWAGKKTGATVEREGLGRPPCTATSPPGSEVTSLPGPARRSH